MTQPQRIDRRSARTRRMLHEALMRLIVSKGYDEVTVQDLLDEADVGRSTFYAHFAGKDELLRRGFEHLRTDLARAQGDSVEREGEHLAFSLAMFEHASHYKDIYRAMVRSRANAMVLAEIRRALLEVVEPGLRRPIRGDVPRELATRFIVDAFQSVLTWWLERKPDLEPDQVHDMFRLLIRDDLME